MPTGEKSCRASRFPPCGIGFSPPLFTVSCAVRGPAVIALPIFSPSADAAFPQGTFPAGESLGRGEAVKGVIDLDRIEVLGVIGEPIRPRQVPGVKNSPPVGILVARGPDMQLPLPRTH